MNEATQPETPIETEVTSRKKEIIIGAIAVAIVIILIAIISISIYNRTPKVVYDPTNACDAFTLSEAKGLLGQGTINSTSNIPVVSKNVAISRCGYADGTPDTNTMVIAAVVVRSGVNDDGVQQNKTEFEQGMPTENIETINNLGDKAYYNQALGQLNVLKGRQWFLLSFGVGSAPESNTVDKAVQLAKQVLN